jgi:hypothetical protein
MLFTQAGGNVHLEDFGDPSAGRRISEVWLEASFADAMMFVML